MRLATGPVGAQLSEVAGFKVAVTGREGEWTSTTPREPATVEREWIDIDQGDDLAAVIAVSQPIWEDVLAHIRTETLPIGKLVIKCCGRDAPVMHNDCCRCQQRQR
jgi:SMODS-associated and fused to various effectors sensor domain